MTVSVTRDWTTPDELDRCTRQQVVRAADGTLTLRRGVTVTDEAGRCTTRDLERVAGLRRARKTFALAALSASAAKLCVYVRQEEAGDDGRLRLEVNGHAAEVPWEEERGYWNSAWRIVDLDPAWLRTGTNEVVFDATGGSAWNLLVEESVHPDRSAVSDDGGRTWRTAALGINDRADGEYVVRLWLDQHAAAGQVTSEAVDLLDGDGDGVACRGTVRSVGVTPTVDLPAGTACTLQWRAGPTPAFAPEAWSAWQALPEAGATPPAGARFFQWRACLSSDDPGVAPSLRAMAVRAEVEVEAPAGARVSDADNRPLVYPSQHFAALSPGDPRGRILRKRWDLDKVVGPTKTEFDAFVRLSKWVRDQWEDGWNMGDIDHCPPWDALLVLELAGRQLALGMCTHYATVFTQACAALGFAARTVVIRAHCVSEVWSNDHGKWVTMDTGGDSNDAIKYTYHYERAGVPMSALEAHTAWVTGDLEGIETSPPRPQAATGHTVEKRIQLWERIMLNPRNDELAAPGPGEPENGKGAYHFDGYLHWEDGETPPLPWYSRHSDRWGDFEWDAEGARIYLQAAGDAGLRVDLEAAGPRSAAPPEGATAPTFEVRLDGGPWEPRPAAFELDLPAGTHRLEARAINAYGRASVARAVTVSV